MTSDHTAATRSDSDPSDDTPQDVGVDEGGATPAATIDAETEAVEAAPAPEASAYAPATDAEAVDTPAEPAPTDAPATDAEFVDTPAETGETDAPATGDEAVDTPAESGEPDAPGTDAEAAPTDAPAVNTPADPATSDPDGASAPAPAGPPVPRPSPGPRPVPRPAPGPRPGASAPHPTPRPAAPASPRPAPAEPWGRVDDDGTVSVREAGGWRVVGQYPDGTPAEALAYFERKYADLAAEVRLLEGRHGAGASAGDLKGTSDALRARLVEAAAVGDLAALVARIEVLDGSLAERTTAEHAAARAAVDEAVRERTALVERIEALAQRNPATLQWKQTTADVQMLFDEWQRQQQDQPRLPKSASQQLWKRFRDARATLDKARREFYSDLDAVHKTARDAKTRLVEQAEALAPRGEDGIGSYRELLDRWKTAGRAGKKADDALWARFKAAGDALYAARGDREAADAEASKEKIETRRALLAEAKGVAGERDIPKARALLTSIQRRWDDTGRVFPRETERSLDDDLRKVEQALRAREDADWKSNDPTTRARADDMTRQLEDAIAKLEADVAAAKASGDKAAEKRASEALAARRSWLGVIGR